MFSDHVLKHTATRRGRHKTPLRGVKNKIKNKIKSECSQCREVVLRGVRAV